MPFSEIYKQVLGGLFPANDYGGLITPEQQAGARQQGLINFGIGLLANSGSGQGLGPRLGQALQFGQQASQGTINDQLQAMLLKSRIAENMRAKVGQDPALVAEFKFAQQNGFTGSFQDYIKSKQAPTQQPSAIQEAEYFAKLTPDQQRQYLEVKRAQATPFQQTDQGGATGAFDRRTGTFTPQVTPQENQDAAAQLKAAQEAAAAAAKIQTERDSTFQQDLNVIDDEILRTQRLLTEFEQGKYQTGPLAGRLPNLRDAAQNLEREQGRDVLKNISSATFGALSEGEREFLKGIGIDPKKNEGSNVAYLQEKLGTLQKAKQRLQTRGPIEPARQNRNPAAASGTAPGSSSRPPLSSFRR